MERDLYAVVRRDRARRRDWRFYAVLGLVLALAAATLLPMAWSIRYQLRYREFVEVLSESTLDSYRTGSFTAERDGETVPLSGGCGYQIYTLAAAAGGERPHHHPLPGRRVPGLLGGAAAEPEVRHGALLLVHGPGGEGHGL